MKLPLVPIMTPIAMLFLAGCGPPVKQVIVYGPTATLYVESLELRERPSTAKLFFYGRSGGFTFWVRVFSDVYGCPSEPGRFPSGVVFEEPRSKASSRTFKLPVGNDIFVLYQVQHEGAFLTTRCFQAFRFTPEEGLLYKLVVESNVGDTFDERSCPYRFSALRGEREESVASHFPIKINSVHMPLHPICRSN